MLEGSDKVKFGWKLGDGIMPILLGEGERPWHCFILDDLGMEKGEQLCGWCAWHVR